MKDQLTLETMLWTIAMAGLIPAREQETSSPQAQIQAVQRRHHLPATGQVDEATQQAIREDYQTALELIRPAQSCVICFPSALAVYPGQSHPHVYLAQAMLTALHKEFRELQAPRLSGLLDPATEEDLRQIQHCSGLPETGILDKPTWNRLNMLYRAIFDRFHAPAQG